MKLFFRRCLPSVFFLLCGIGAPAIYGQALIHGNVKNTDGMPIPGVNVQLAGTTLGTTTDFEGDFQLVAEAQDSIVVSYMGYVSQQLPVGTQTEFEIILQEDEQSLGELVINAGYYTTTERERTGNIAKVTAEEIELQPLVSPLQALQGRMAGVEITPNSDVPGAAPTIRIRGQNSLRSEGNYPLYIVDGMPLNSTAVESNTIISFAGVDPLSTLNLNNIESIEVLKDADATAIYGSRGANGVVLITTKKGGGQQGVQARVYRGVASLPRRLELLTTAEYLQMRRTAFANDGVEPDEMNAYDLVLWDQERYTDWQEEFLGGRSQITDVNLSAQGGNEQTHFRLNGSFHEQGSIYPVDLSYQKFTGGFHLNHHSKDDRLHLDLAINYGVDHNKLLGGEVNFKTLAFKLPPNAPQLYQDDGSLTWDTWAAAGLSHPLEGVFNASTIKTQNLITNLNLRYLLLEGLEVKANVGYTHFNGEELIKMPKRSYNPAGMPRHSSISGDRARTSWIIEPQVHYTRQWDQLQLEAFIGSTLQENNSSQFNVKGENYVAESLIGNLGAAESLINANAQHTDYRYQALFSRLGFNWDQKYYLNLTGRRDGSSRFAEGKRFANFGAIGAAWIFSEESFFEDHVNWFSFGKLRASYGTTGSDQIPDYGYLDAYEATPGPGGLYPTALANPAYSWEVNKKAEVGVQLGFLAHRLSLGISRYRNRSSNQLVGYPLPATTGFGNVQANLPATVENKGWEIEFSSEPFRTKPFSWQTSFNISIPQNELVRYPGLAQSPYADRYREGEPLAIALLYAYEGLDEATGFYSVKDQNEDGVYDAEDKVVIHDQTQAFFGGLSNTLTYKGISLQFLFQFVKQKGSVTSLFKSGFAENQLQEFLNDAERTPQLSQSPAAAQAYSRVVDSDLVVEDASFIRLKTLNLSYDLPDPWVKAVHLRGARFFIGGQNLWTLTNYHGMDPEQPIGGLSFSSLRTFTGGFQVNF